MRIGQSLRMQMDACTPRRGSHTTSNPSQCKHTHAHTHMHAHTHARTHAHAHTHKTATVHARRLTTGGGVAAWWGRGARLHVHNAKGLQQGLAFSRWTGQRKRHDTRNRGCEALPKPVGTQRGEPGARAWAHTAQTAPTIHSVSQRDTPHPPTPAHSVRSEGPERSNTV
jgi:hypothetical protein